MLVSAYQEESRFDEAEALLDIMRMQRPSVHGSAAHVGRCALGAGACTMKPPHICARHPHPGFDRPGICGDATVVGTGSGGGRIAWKMLAIR